MDEKAFFENFYTDTVLHTNCHHHALMSMFAYLPPEKAKSRFRMVGFNEVKFININGAQCYVAWSSTRLVVAFRGTNVEEINDLKANVDVIKDEYELGGEVHSGFKEEVDKLKDIILSIVNKEEHANKAITITGHSLGGAMATIFAGYIKDKVKVLYTYGSPRVGDQDFCDAIADIVHYRFTNNNDGIPYLPPRIAGYRHHGVCVYIDYNGVIKNYSKWNRFKDKVKGYIKAYTKGQAYDILYDHGIAAYCEVIKP